MPKAQISSLASSHRGGCIGCEEDRHNAGHDHDDYDQTEKGIIGCDDDNDDDDDDDKHKHKPKEELKFSCTKAVCSTISTARWSRKTSFPVQSIHPLIAFELVVVLLHLWWSFYDADADDVDADDDVGDDDDDDDDVDDDHDHDHADVDDDDDVGEVARPHRRVSNHSAVSRHRDCSNIYSNAMHIYTIYYIHTPMHVFFNILQCICSVYTYYKS